jgi:hypothetical protein
MPLPLQLSIEAFKATKVSADTIQAVDPPRRFISTQIMFPVHRSPVPRVRRCHRDFCISEDLAAVYRSLASNACYFRAIPRNTSEHTYSMDLSIITSEMQKSTIHLSQNSLDDHNKRIVSLSLDGCSRGVMTCPYFIIHD